MFIVNFSGYNQRKYGQYSLGHIKLEYCFDHLTELFRQGWQLDSIQLFDGRTKINLPVEAFDSESMRHSMEELQNQWEAILH